MSDSQASTALIKRMNDLSGLWDQKSHSHSTGDDAQLLGYRHFGPRSDMNRFMIQGRQDIKLWVKEVLCYINFNGWSEVLHEEYPDTEKNRDLHTFIVSCIPGIYTKFDYDLVLLIGHGDDGKSAFDFICSEYGVKIDTTEDPRPLWCEKCWTRDTTKCKQWFLYLKGKIDLDNEGWYDENLWQGNEMNEQKVTSALAIDGGNVTGTVVPFASGSPVTRSEELAMKSCIKEDSVVKKRAE